MNTSNTSIVTGGGRGIGRAIAMRLARETNVVVVGRTETDLTSVCAEIETTGGRARYLVGDVREPATATRAMQLVTDQNWTVRNLVYNAGIGKSASTHTVSDDAWTSIMDTNLTGAFFFARAVLPQMAERRSGAICFIGSTASLKGFSHEAAYTASKHGLVGLAKTIALEYGKRGIVCVPVCPNFVEGEMTLRTIKGVMERKNISMEEARALVESKNPQHRIIPASEVAEAVAFVCSGHVPSLSGQPLILGMD